MGFLPNVSSSDVQSEKLHMVDPPSLISLGATVRTTTLTDNNCRASKKRKRNDTIARAVSPLNEISDDSDASSDDEKSLPIIAKHRLCHHKRRTGRKRVAFGDASSTTLYHPSPLTKGELKGLKGDLWFTKQDRLKSQAECLQVLKTFRAQNAEEVNRFSDVYKTSMQFSFSQESSDFLERATVSVPLTIRGMEWGISPKLKKRRKEHIQSVLTLQKGIRDSKLRERFVSSRSVQSSRGARIMARMIGEGDAMAGTTSTALNVTPLNKKPPKQPLQEQPQNRQESDQVPTQKTTKLGRARRRRRPMPLRK